MRTPIGAALMIWSCTALAHAADWPMYGADSARGNFTSETLAAPLSLSWTYRAAHAPMPAWPVSERQPFDWAYQPVIAGTTLFFGSSADGQVHALDMATGKERWTFFTDGPVRFAPAVWKDRLFVASDDGCLYCLAASDGKLLWKRRGGPDERMVLGNDRMVSRWPARGGPVVRDGVVYFGAGIWPSDGIYLVALDAESGKTIWLNDHSGSIYMAQPHGGANAHSGVSSQGYLVATDELLLVPTGRAVPAAFRRSDGKFLYFHLQQNGHKGGTATLASGPSFINAGLTFDAPTGTALDPIGAGAVAALPDGIVRAAAKDVTAFKWTDKEKRDRKGALVRYKGLEKLWTIPVTQAGTSLVVAGKMLVSGGKQHVSLLEIEAKKEVWSAEIDGTPYGLVVAAGRLFVSTDQGTIYCFAPRGPDQPAVVRTEPKAGVYGDNAIAAAAAQAIIAQAGITEGYCVDLGCGDGALAYELARRTRLQIYALDPDPTKVALARRKLDASGLYGVRVTVHQGKLTQTPYPRFFANLIVSTRALTEGPDSVPADEVFRLQRPYGGVACLGKPGELKKAVRGALVGAGSWTHQYADAANTCCSADALVKGPLGMLWYRDSDFEMPQRHGRGPAPLFTDGRLFVEGLNGLRTVDAYNGRTLWELPLNGILKPYHGEHLMGTSGTGSNVCVSTEGVFVRAEDRCLRIDAATGKQLTELMAPKRHDGKPGVWAYLASADGTLFGSLANEEHIVKWRYGKGDMSKQFTESDFFFALDVATGKVKWSYAAKHSLRHNAIAIGGGRVYLIDRPPAEMDLITAPTAKDAKQKEHPLGRLLALDAATGQVIWQSADDIDGTLLALSVKHDVLLMGYQPTAFRLPSEKGGQLTGFQAATGKRLWDKKATYTTRPLINDHTVYAQGGAWDLKTGEDRPFSFKRSYGCGQLAGSEHLMVFRSATLGYFDLTSSAGIENYGGIRPGCWINAIPAGGIVLVPDASSGCQCSYLNQAWIALQALRD